MSGYNRKSINLIEDNRRFGINNKKVFGSCVLEEKSKENKIIVKVENLKKEFKYNVYAIFVKKGQYIGVDIGEIKIKNNRHQLKREIVKGEFEDKFKVKEKDILAIIVGVKTEINVITVLEGFVDKKIRYKGNFYIQKNTIDIEGVKEKLQIQKKLIKNSSDEKVNSKLKIVDQNKKQLAPMEYKEGLEEKGLEEKALEKKALEEKGLEEKALEEKALEEKALEEKELEKKELEEKELEKKELEKKELEEKALEEKELEEKGLEEKELEEESLEAKELKAKVPEEEFFKEFFDKNTNENVFEIIINKLKEEYDEIMESENSKFNESETSVLKVDNEDPKGNLKYLLKYGNKIEPFKTQKREVKWVVINIEDLTAIYDNCWEIRRNEVLLEGYKKYKHLMLGEYEEDEEKKYILGIPNKYDEEDKEVVIKIGGVQYKEVDTEDMRSVCPGYWLILVSK